MPKSQNRMKLLVRSKAICHDDGTENLDPEYPLESPLSSSSTFISDSIFPSPFPISREEAIKETVGHVHSKNFDDAGDGLPNGEKGAEPDAEALSNSLSEKIIEFENQQDASPVSVDTESTLPTSKPSATTPRREPEKPPRMQKQRSQDRLLLLKQQKPSFDSDTKRENLSRESSFECVDSTGVDVHEFLINTLRNSARDRVILLKLEHDMMAFVSDKTIDFMKFPPMTSYHRMLVHRVAAYFGMDHNVDETGKCVIINKTSSTRLPEARFAEHFDPRQVDQPTGRRDDDMRRRSILKRTNQSRSFDRDDIKGRSMWKDNRQRSIEEREEEYEKIRARIFNNQEANMTSPMYGRRGMSSMAAAKMASWSDRPWNSTDMESVPSTVRMQIPRPLTTRASSYSSISVLPRHNSATSVKTGSSSSISSMGGGNGLQTYAQNRQNMGNPRPPTPVRRGGGSNMGESNNGTYYYMQQQNQDYSFDAVEDDIMESWFEVPESPEPTSSYDSGPVVPTDVPILLAVPPGVTLPPETILCHPFTGMPYLSPEGYQLVYQSGPGATGPPGISSPQYAQYYQVPPQPSPQHPGVGFTQAQGYSPYQESPQKPGGANMIPGSTGAEYPLMAQSPSSFVPISSYQQIPSSSSSTFTAVPNMNYSYQPSAGMPMYANTQEQMVSGQNSGIATSQNAMHVHPMMYSPMQGKPQTAPYGSQGMPQAYQQQVPAGASYPPYAVTQAANQGGPVTSQQGGTKEGLVSGQMQNPGVATTPRALHTQPPTIMQVQPQSSQQYASYPQQQMQLVYSAPAPQPAPARASTEMANQSTQGDVSKPSQSQEAKTVSDKELSDKMQAIVLKNLQKQGAASEANNESATSVTTSISPPTKPTHTSQQSMADGSNQIRMTPVALPLQRPPSEQQVYPNQPHYQYTNSSGVQQPQTMQVYLMPRSNQVPTGASYRTYSQFMTQPQTPHVMGPGMHFVYLSPPMGGVVGMDGAGAATIPPNTQILHSHPQQHMHQPHVTAPHVPATNTNNNNVVTDIVQQSVSSARTGERPEDPGARHHGGHQYAGADAKPAANPEGNNQNKPGAMSGSNGVQSRLATTKPGILKNGHSHPKTVSSSAPASTADTAFYSIANATTTATYSTGARSASNDHPQQHASTQYMTQSNQPLLLGSNLPRDYRIAGVNPNNPVPFNANVVPQYSMYPGVNALPTMPPYVKYYLPANAAVGQKMPDVKMYQGATSPSNLIAVQLPNQNQIQFVPTAMPPPSPIYYATHNHNVTNEYNTAQQSSKASSYTDNENKPQVLTAQVSDVANEIKPDERSENEESATSTHKAEKVDVTGTPQGSRTGRAEASPDNSSLAM